MIKSVKPKALITGITGQDGYYLTDFLINKGYEVHGTIRRSSSINTSRIDGLISKYKQNGQLNLHYSDLIDSSSLSSLVAKIRPAEIYNLGAQSHVAVSFENPMLSTQVGNIGTLSLLESIKSIDSGIKFYQASSSEMYGGGAKEMLDESSQFDPKSPYAASKVFSHNITKVYRDSYNLFASNGILFNHESPHRGETFVTRKITRALGRINHKIQSRLTLGNLNASRDWGFAGDYVEGMWLMMQYEKPDDWVLSTGESYSVENFLEESFKLQGLDWNEFIDTDEKYLRPNEVEFLLGDSTKARELLKWESKTSFKELVEMMVMEDDKLAQREKVLISNGLLTPTWENPI
jgi:GDPmannose 4,6-dehydratase